MLLRPPGNQRSEPHTDYFVLSSFPSNDLLIECLVFPECDRNIFFTPFPVKDCTFKFSPSVIEWRVVIPEWWGVPPR
jgi:hypothetical protein